MKDTEIPWIGKIPSEWEIQPFKRNATIYNGCDYKHIQAEEGYPVIGSGGTFAYATDYMYDGEAVLLGRKGTIDKPLYVNGKFWTVDTMFYAVPNKNCCAKYLYYQSINFPFDFYSSSTALPSMKASDLANNLIVVPPIEEQEEIANFLDEKCDEIQNLISIKEKEIQILKEYQKSLIYEYSTGKKRVNK